MSSRIKIFLLVAILVSSSNTNAQHSIRLVLKDQSILKSNIVKLFVTIDSTGFGSPQVLTKSINEISIKSPNFLVWANDQHVVPYFVKPGETISVKVIKKNNLLLFIESDYQRSNEIDFFRKLSEKYSLSYFNSSLKKARSKFKQLDSLKKMAQVIKNIDYKKNQFLDSFLNKNLIGKEFYLIAKSVLKAYLISDIQILNWYNRDLLIKNSQYDSIVNQTFKQVKQIPFSPYFINFQINRFAISMIMSKYLDYEITDSLNLMKRMQFVNREYIGIAKYFMLTNTIKSALYHSYPISDRHIQFYFKNCEDHGCKGVIQDLLDSKKKQKSVPFSNSLLRIDTATISDLYVVLNAQKSEYILLDFWASWCAPCRKAMPESEKLRKKFSNKGIQFIYLSIDEDISSWKSAHQLENLPDSSSFLLLNSDKSNIVKQNKVSFIPRYMLVSKNGKIINADLPHIGDIRLVAILNKLISSKN